MLPVSMQPRALIMSSDEADWASEICDCCHDAKQCCCLFWCCPCFACKTTKEFGQCVCLPLLDVFSCFRPITMSTRTSVRHRYGIRGSLCRDCLCATFCPACVWSQISTEMKDKMIPTMLSDIIQYCRGRRCPPGRWAALSRPRPDGGSSNTCSPRCCCCCCSVLVVTGRLPLNRRSSRSSRPQHDEGEEGEGRGRGPGGGRRRRGEREVLPGAGRQREPHLSAARLQEAEQEAVQVCEEGCQGEEHPPRSEGSSEVHQQGRERHRGDGRRHAAHRRLLPPARHVRGPEPAVRLHPLQSGSGFVGGI